MWFEELTEFREKGLNQVHSNLSVEVLMLVQFFASFSRVEKQNDLESFVKYNQNSKQMAMLL
ncbi:MAG: hypothetical protein D3903_14145 [Candidatus Electrothrix sp. GM3_4]|nr:hypothetical protein [Candidatus Electrothrix sp. GM3_4]